MICNNCSWQNPSNSKYCLNCANPLVFLGVSCSNINCGHKEMRSGAKYCPRCGNTLLISQHNSRSTVEKNKFNKRVIIISLIVLPICAISFLINYNTDKNKGRSEVIEEKNIEDVAIPMDNISIMPDTLENVSKRPTKRNSSEKTPKKKIPGLYPFASERLLISDDLINLSAYELKIMRNEIYARHGFVFMTTEMKNYFNQQQWYISTKKLANNNQVGYLLSEIEKKNVDLIKSYE